MRDFLAEGAKSIYSQKHGPRLWASDVGGSKRRVWQAGRRGGLVELEVEN